MGLHFKEIINFGSNMKVKVNAACEKLASQGHKYLLQLDEEHM